MKQDPGFFISYANEDSAYSTRLVDHLRSFGLPLWFYGDQRVGARFTLEIRQRIRHACAVIVIMSPAAEESEWVEREILESQFRGRDFVPILLKGDRLFLLASSHYFDARDGALPDEKLIRQLRDMHKAQRLGIDQRPSLTLPTPVVRPSARTTHPTGASLQKLWDLLKEGQIEHADILTTSLLLEAAGQLNSGWMRMADGKNLSFVLLADIDAAWSRFSQGRQGFESQLLLHRRHPHGAPAGRQRDFTMLAMAVGWKSTYDQTMPKYESFATGKRHFTGFFPTLRNPQVERNHGWYDRWVETVMAVHLQLRKWVEQQ